MLRIAMLTMLAVVGACCYAADDVPLMNPGFERGPVGWVPSGTWGGFSPADRETLLQIMTDKPHTGEKCLKVSDTWDQYSPYVVQQNVPADPAKSYVLKVWVRSDTPTKGRINIMMMEDSNGSDKFRGTVQETFSANEEWKEVTMVLEKVLPRTARMVISLVPNAGEKAEKSTLYFDDVSLKALTAEELKKFLTE